MIAFFEVKNKKFSSEINNLDMDNKSHTIFFYHYFSYPCGLKKKHKSFIYRQSKFSLIYIFFIIFDNHSFVRERRKALYSLGTFF